MLKYPSKHDRLHQDLDYIVYSWYIIDLIVLNIFESVNLC